MKNNDQNKAEQPKEKPSQTLFVEILKTDNYGLFQASSKIHGMEAIESKLLGYYISRIQCELKSNSCITGLKLSCRNRTDNSKIDVIDIPSKKKTNLVQEYNFEPSEFITEIRVWMQERLTGFEIATNKGSVKKFGYGEEDSLLKIPEFEIKDKIVVGFEFCADEKDGVTGLCCYYLNRNKFLMVLHTGLIYLKVKLKNEEFRKKTEKKAKYLNSKFKTIYQACLLPDHHFFEVMKYVMDPLVACNSKF